MPKIVDHETQRRRIAEAAIRLIARDGFEGMTMRAVAAEAGLSYGSLFHYFDSKDELLVHAVRQLTAQQSRRVNDFSSRSSSCSSARSTSLQPSGSSPTARICSSDHFQFPWSMACRSDAGPRK